MIRQATLQDVDQIEEGYLELLSYEKTHTAYTVWKEGVYPTRQTAKDAVSKGTMYVKEEDEKIYASIIVDQMQPFEYESIKWKYQATKEEVLVIHLLCVRPSAAGKGIGKEMIRFVIDKSKSMNCKTVRLDTGSQNIPAKTLYTKMGFELAETKTMAIGGLISHHNHLFFELKV